MGLVNRKNGAKRGRWIDWQNIPTLMNFPVKEMDGIKNNYLGVVLKE